jgi:hypothetical protein
MRVNLGRTTRITAVVLILLVAFVAMNAHTAFARCGSGTGTEFCAYTSGVQVANLSSTDDANILIVAYKSDGTTDGSPLGSTIPKGAAKTYFPISNVSVGFSGSIVISSNTNIAAIANTVTPDFLMNSSYVGRSQGGTTLQIPLLMKDNSGYFTWYAVQNAGSAAANVQVNYSDGTTASETIPPGASKTFYQEKETHSAKVFSAIINSTNSQPLVGAVIQERADNILAYTAFTGGSTNPIFPLVNANNSGIRTGIQIQNVGTQNTDVTVSYVPAAGSGNGTACTETKTIEGNGKSKTFAFVMFELGGDGGDCTAKGRFVGSASVTTNSTNQPLVAVVNQLYPASLGSGSSAYVAFAPTDAGDTVVLPLIMDRNSGYFTGISVSNVGTSAVDINCTFQNTSYTANANVAPGGALVDIQNNKIADKYVGSAVCTGGAGSQLVAVVNEFKNASGDQAMTYEGIKR